MMDDVRNENCFDQQRKGFKIAYLISKNDDLHAPHDLPASHVPLTIITFIFRSLQNNNNNNNIEWPNKRFP